MRDNMEPTEQNVKRVMFAELLNRNRVKTGVDTEAIIDEWSMTNYLENFAYSYASKCEEALEQLLKKVMDKNNIKERELGIWVIKRTFHISSELVKKDGEFYVEIKTVPKTAVELLEQDENMSEYDKEMEKRLMDSIFKDRLKGIQKEN